MLSIQKRFIYTLLMLNTLHLLCLFTVYIQGTKVRLSSGWGLGLRNIFPFAFIVFLFMIRLRFWFTNHLPIEIGLIWWVCSLSGTYSPRSRLNTGTNNIRLQLLSSLSLSSESVRPHELVDLLSKNLFLPD